MTVGFLFHAIFEASITDSIPLKIVTADGGTGEDAATFFSSFPSSHHERKCLP